jgi:DNA topoisomerase-1
MYKTKSKNAQEAHEAIRPTDLWLNINKNKDLTSFHQKLYNLIFNRVTATQMKEAQIQNTKIKIRGQKGYIFQTQWENIVFKGYLIIYPQKKEEIHLGFKKNQILKLKSLNFDKSLTNPPPRYNEASLIKTLEERGIGRPSTYAPIVSTVQERQYVEKQDGRFYPTIIGTTVCDYLSKTFPAIFNINFTVDLEDSLDLIANGNKDFIQVLNQFYLPFKTILAKEISNKRYINIQEKTDEECPQCHHDLVFRYSRFGKFYACSNYPECKYTKPYFEKINKKCPTCEGDLIIKYTKRKKRFYGCSRYPKCNYAVWRLNQIRSS